ncbi:uncharacterized protein L199_004314 [Kwoniella botswanensis]|uniref:uncharacterized protein n=1 Tax=Kwoniella botswanensis TaxID=1268659 RepID=UPI00315D8CAF
MSDCFSRWCPGSDSYSQTTNTNEYTSIHVSQAEMESLSKISDALHHLPYKGNDLNNIQSTIFHLSRGAAPSTNFQVPTDADLKTISNKAPALALHSQNARNVFRRAQGQEESTITYTDQSGARIASANQWDNDTLRGIRQSMIYERRQHGLERGEPSGTQPTSSGRDWA